MNKLLTVAFAIAFSSVVSANEAAVVKTSFQSIDTDQNGVISPAEASDNKTLSLAFAKLDTDSDGTLSETEYSKFNG